MRCAKVSSTCSRASGRCPTTRTPTSIGSRKHHCILISALTPDRRLRRINGGTDAFAPGSDSRHEAHAVRHSHEHQEVCYEQEERDGYEQRPRCELWGLFEEDV